MWLPAFALYMLHRSSMSSKRLWTESDSVQASRTDRDAASAREYLPHLVSSLGTELREEVLRVIADARAMTPGHESTRSFEQDMLARELAHALSTPLAQIEVSGAALSRAVSAVDASADTHAALASVKVSVFLCKAYLGALRGAAAGFGSREPAPFQRMVEDVLTGFSESSHSRCVCQVVLPDMISGYSSLALTGLLGALLENAVEGCSEGGTVRVSYWTELTDHLLEVKNSCAERPSSEMADPGFTTKEGHQGLGLPLVQHLLRGYPGSELKTEWRSGTMHCLVRLPAREAT